MKINLFNILLFVHIAAGSLSLITGLVIMFIKKGGQLHRIIGNFYFYSLTAGTLVSFPMAYLHRNLFLFIIGVFTTYMLLTGKSYLNKKSISDVHLGDWLLSSVMLVFGSGFILLGTSYLIKGLTFGIVLLVFGMISLIFVMQDWRTFRGRSPYKNYWLTTHLQRMVGSYIASATAFLVVNNTLLPGTVAWLLPTAILTPLIVRWTKKRVIFNDQTK